MLAEHLVYSTAIAVIAGMLSFHYTGRDASWIIILCTYLPDLDKIGDSLLNSIGFTVLFEGHTIHHGTFHNFAAMLIFGISIAFLLHPLGVRFFDAMIFAIMGFGAHLFEDALVYPSNYMYLWPFSGRNWDLHGFLSEDLRRVIQRIFFISPTQKSSSSGLSSSLSPSLSGPGSKDQAGSGGIFRKGLSEIRYSR